MESRPYSSKSLLSRVDLDKLKNDFIECHLRVRDAVAPPEEKYTRLIDTIDTMLFKKQVNAATTAEIDESLNVLMPDVYNSTEKQNTFLMLASRYHKKHGSFKKLIQKATPKVFDEALDVTNAMGQSTFQSIIKYQLTPSVLAMLQLSSLEKLTVRLREKAYPSSGGFKLYWLSDNKTLNEKAKDTTGLAAIFVGKYPEITVHFYLNHKRLCDSISEAILSPEDHELLAPDDQGNITKTPRNIARINQILQRLADLTRFPDYRETGFIELLKHHGADALLGVMQKSILLARELFKLADLRHRNSLETDVCSNELIPMFGAPRHALAQQKAMIYKMDYLGNPYAYMKKRPVRFMRFIQTILPKEIDKIADHDAWDLILKDAFSAAPQQNRYRDQLLAMSYRVGASRSLQGNISKLAETSNFILKINSPKNIPVHDNLLIANTLTSFSAEEKESSDEKAKLFQLKALQHLYYAAKQGNDIAKESLFKHDSQKLKKLRLLLEEKLDKLTESASRCCFGFFSKHRQDIMKTKQALQEYIDFREAPRPKLVLQETAKNGFNRLG